MALFLDTSFLVAVCNTGDTNHYVAKELFERVKRRRTASSLVVTDYIFDEFATLLLSRIGKPHAVAECSKLMNDPMVGLVHVTPNLFKKSWEVFASMTDKEWSFTDCTSYVVMKELRIGEAASFDKHFRQFGFTCLP
jgi:predicted nucleic acid-binding protein